MAITTLQTPELISPVYNNMYFLCSSNYSLETGFKYVFILENLDGIIADKKVLPYPNTLGSMDVSTLLRNFLNNNLSFNITGITNSTESIYQYKVSIGHTGSTHTQTPVDQGIRYAINSVDNDDIDIQEYIMKTGTTGKFLTNSPSVKIYDTDYYTLSYLNGVFNGYISDVNEVWYKVYYKNGDIGLYYFEVPDGYLHTPTISVIENVDKMYRHIPVGVKNIQQMVLLDYYDSDEPITLDFSFEKLVKYYEVWTADDSSQRTSDIFRFDINTDNTKYERIQLAFLNRWGNYSYITLIGKNEETTKVNRSSYLRNPVYLINNKLVEDKSKGGLTTYSVDTETEYLFSSGYLDQSTYDYCDELFTSPAIFWLKDGVPIPLVITDTTWVNRKKLNDKEIQFNIKVKLSNKKRINI